MATPDFSGLTPAQARLLTVGGWKVGAGKMPRPQTVRKLLERGLVIEHKRPFMGTTVCEFAVPERVQAAWKATGAAA